MSTSIPRHERRLDRQVTFIVVGVIVALMLTAATAVGAAVYRYTNGGAVSNVRTASTVRSPDPGERFYIDSDTYIAIPGAGVEVTVPARKRAILIITFSLTSNCAGSARCWIGAFVDGTQVTPEDVTWDTGASVDYQYGARSFQWVSTPLGPGTHYVTMAGKVNGTTVFGMEGSVLTVLRAKA